MSDGKIEVEGFLIAVSVTLTILQNFNNSLEMPAFIIGSLLVAWLIYDKIPRLLNRRLSDENKAFTTDVWLRFGLLFFSSAMFMLFVLNIYFGYFILPESLLGINALELTHSVYGAIALVFISIYYFSWWLWKYPDLARQLWKMTTWTETEFKKEKATAERSKLYSLISKYLGPGVVPMAICVLLFMGWLVLSIVDLLMIGLLLLWLFNNILKQLPLKFALRKWDVLTGRDLVWKAVTRAGIASLDSVMDSILIILGFMIIVLLATISWSGFIVVLVFFNGWFILFMLFAIGLRSSARTRVRRGDQKIEESSYISMPSFKDLLLFCSLVMISLFSIIVWFQLTEFASAVGCAAIALNVCTLIMTIRWLRPKKDKRRALRCRPSEHNEEERKRLKRDLLRDRYRLYTTSLILGLPIVAAAKTFSAVVVWTGIVGGVIFLCFDADFRKKVQKQEAWVYASLLTGYMGTGIAVILGAAMYGLPELTTFLVPLGLMFIVLLVVYWLAIYRIKRRWKWK